MSVKSKNVKYYDRLMIMIYSGILILKIKCTSVEFKIDVKFLAERPIDKNCEIVHNMPWLTPSLAQ